MERPFQAEAGRAVFGPSSRRGALRLRRYPSTNSLKKARVHWNGKRRARKRSTCQSDIVAALNVGGGLCRRAGEAMNNERRQTVGVSIEYRAQIFVRIALVNKKRFFELTSDFNLKIAVSSNAQNCRNRAR